MRHLVTISLVLCLSAAGGCRYCCWGKRASEKSCPTDVRQTHFWCFGEDAIFHHPCGPDAEFYGHRPTCWREWPMSGADWRDTYCPRPCGPVAPYDSEMHFMPGVPGPVRAPGAANPFREDLDGSPQPGELKRLPALGPQPEPLPIVPPQEEELERPLPGAPLLHQSP
jgi:hypothetical protein